MTTSPPLLDHASQQQPATAPAPSRAGAAVALLGAAGVLVAAACFHLTQGTSGVGVGDLFVDGRGRDILLDSRVPRLAAAIAVGFALGAAGALFQSIARNALASPDTLAVTAGAFFAVSLVAALGLAVPLWASGLTAFAGGLAAAVLVMVLAGGVGSSTTRLVLAGSAVALAVEAGTAMLLILFEEETTGLYAWSSGSLSQLDLTAFLQAAPLVLAATGVALALSRRLDLLGLGDDAAGSLGVPVRSTRAIGTILAVLLTAAAVTLAGPIGFVGLAAPTIVRLVGRLIPGVHRHAVLVPMSGLVGALVVVGADVAIRAVLGADQAVQVPTGVATTMLGALVLVVLARRLRDAGATRQPRAAGVRVRSRTRFVVVLLVALAAAIGVGVLGLLAGYTWLRTGDVALWINGDAPLGVRFALDERAPRVAGALAAGAALALAGCLVQATCRNPLAEPGILGITGGAGLGAVIVVTGSAPSTSTMLVASVAGSLVVFAAVYLLSWRGGLNSDRLVIVGIGVWAFTTSVTTFLLLRSNPWDTPRIYTWLSGSTYGRSFDQVLPLVIVLAVLLPVTSAIRRELDLLAIDEDTPRLAGVRLEGIRLLALTMSAVLAATSVVAVGVVGFVGLVAPHAARALVGTSPVRVVPVAVLLGVVVLGLADALGRTVIAPDQIPVGLVVALIGAPYFVYLLWRSRA